MFNHIEEGSLFVLSLVFSVSASGMINSVSSNLGGVVLVFRSLIRTF